MRPAGNPMVLLLLNEALNNSAPRGCISISKAPNASVWQRWSPRRRADLTGANLRNEPLPIQPRRDSSSRVMQATQTRHISSSPRTSNDSNEPQTRTRQTTDASKAQDLSTAGSTSAAITPTPPPPIPPAFPAPPAPSATNSRLHQTTSSLLSALNSLSHRLNIYTGTDYTPIDLLRSQIVTQEHHLKTLSTSLAASKTSHTAALNKRAAAQKEVVQLLERKHSWSGPDLERYMSLIRSEHVDDQGVAETRADLEQSERELEEGRKALERLERQLYHEEQVWSDTIRRNSTWVTFGLMGVNVGLLVASLVLIEPWRRRRLVREIRGALDEKAVAVPAGTTVMMVDKPVVEAAVPTMDQSVEQTRESGAPVATVLALSEEAPALVDAQTRSEPSIPIGSLLHASPIDEKAGTWELYKAYWADLFSDRRVALRKRDLTATAVEGAAAGAALMGLLFVLLRPR